MIASTLLLSTLAALVAGSPIAARDPNIFHVSNFVFGCTTTCDWYYDVTVVNDAVNHPRTGSVHCQGSLDSVTSFDTAASACDFISDSQKLSTFIDQDNNLQLRYKYENTTLGGTFWYEGSTPVNAATSGKPQATDFSVPETKAYAIAK